MKILAIETTSPVGSVALFDGVQLLKEISWTRTAGTNASHSEMLTPHLELLAKETSIDFSQLDLIAVDIGPGSFTGIRVGINAVRALGYSLNIPVVPLTSLEILAESAMAKNKKRTLVAINAFRNFIYTAVFEPGESSPKTVISPQALTPENFKSLLETEVQIVGDGAEFFLKSVSNSEREHITVVDPSIKFPTAKTLGQLALSATKKQNWFEVVPLYLRKSEAEEKLGG